MGLPAGTILSYVLVSDSSVCSLRKPRRGSTNREPVLTIKTHGTCKMQLAVQATGYVLHILHATLTINKGTMSDLAWEGYASDTINQGDNAPALTSPTGAPDGTTFAYSTTTTTVCTVDSSTGALTIVGTGTCTVSLTATNSNYNNGTKTATVTVN